MDALASLTAWACGMVALGAALAAGLAARAQLRRQAPRTEWSRGLSILKPLKGLDPRLEENLESFFRLEHPSFELCFCLEDAGDPALGVVQKLMARHPEVRARVFFIAASPYEAIARTIPNPKVRNLFEAFYEARYDLLLISDSNVYLNSEGLRALSAAWKPGIGVVTAAVAGRGAQGFGGRLEAAYLNSFYFKILSLAASVGRTCVIGKAMLFSRKQALRFGGLRTLGAYLAEDHQTGVEFARMGMPSVLSAESAFQRVGRLSVTEFWRRHLRWGRMRRLQAPLAFAFEPLTFFGVGAPLASFAVAVGMGWEVGTVLPWVALTWAVSDLALLIQVGGVRGGREITLHVGAWLAREVLALPLWLHMAVGREVLWRGQKIRLAPGGLIAPGPSASVAEEAGLALPSAS